MPELSDKDTIEEARGHGGKESGETAESEQTGNMEDSEIGDERRIRQKKVLKVKCKEMVGGGVGARP